MHPKPLSVHHGRPVPGAPAIEGPGADLRRSVTRVPLTPPAHLPRSLGALRSSEHGVVRSVKAEIRDHLLTALRAGR